MPRVGITGHINLSPTSAEPVYHAIVAALGELGGSGLTGVSCIAAGADSLFATAVLDLGGRLEVVLPSRTYRDRQVKPDHAELFDDLLSRASTIRIMPFEDADRIAYEAANESLVAGIDRLFAVWDGSVGKRGGTGSVVTYAQGRGVPVRVIWPPGAARG